MVIRRFPFRHPTHASFFQMIGPTSAYLSHYSEPWLFGSSSSERACGLDTFSLYRPSMRDLSEFPCFECSFCAALDAVLSTGLLVGRASRNVISACFFHV